MARASGCAHNLDRGGHLVRVACSAGGCAHNLLPRRCRAPPRLPAQRVGVRPRAAPRPVLPGHGQADARATRVPLPALVPEPSQCCLRPSPGGDCRWDTPALVRSADKRAPIRIRALPAFTRLAAPGAGDGRRDGRRGPRGVSVARAGKPPRARPPALSGTDSCGSCVSCRPLATRASEDLLERAKARRWYHTFELARRILGSKVERVNRNIYDATPEELGTFDLVFCATVLVHVRDQLLALERIANLCAGTFIFADEYDPLAGLAPFPASRYLAD